MAALPPIHPNQAPRTNNIGGISVREDLLFTDANGKEKSAVRKAAEAALEKLKSILPKLLEPGETVLYITAAIAPVSLMEQMTLGVYAFQLKGVTLVFTDRRLLRFRRKGKAMRDWEWSRGLQTVRWGDVGEATVKGWLTRVLTLKYRTGRQEVYRIAGYGPGKKVGVLVPALVLPGTGGTGAATGQDMTSACPECLKTLTLQTYQCGGCGLPFKNEKTLLWRNFLIPGGGFFYTGWSGLGILQMLPDVFLTLGILYFALVAAHVVPAPPPDPGQKAVTGADAVVVVIILLVLLLLENSIAWLHTRKLVRDFIPER